MRAKCRSVYAFRQVWRFMQESRGRFNPWEPLRSLPTMLWPSRFRAALTRRNLAPAKPHGTLPLRPAAIRVVWIARHTVHTTDSATATSDNLREKNYCEIKQPNAAPCPQNWGQGVGWVLRDTVVEPVSTTLGETPILRGAVASPVSVTRCKVLDGTRHSRIQKKGERNHGRATETEPSRSPYAVCAVVSPIGAGQ